MNEVSIAVTPEELARVKMAFQCVANREQAAAYAVLAEALSRNASKVVFWYSESSPEQNYPQLMIHHDGEPAAEVQSFSDIPASTLAILWSDNWSFHSGVQACDVNSDAILAGKPFARRQATEFLHRSFFRYSSYFWERVSATVVRNLAGYPLRVSVQGVDIARPDALDGNEVRGAFGQYLLRERVFTGGLPRIYLNGICVYGHQVNINPAPDLGTVAHNAVHLDPKQFQATLDGDRVVGESSMVAMVLGELRSIYEERLVDFKRSLTGIDFCRQAYQLAVSLDRLHVFNDVPDMPADWLGVVEALPSTIDDGTRLVTPLCTAEHTALRMLDSVSREDIDVGKVTLAKLSEFQEWSGGEFNQMAWMLAYGCKALAVMQRLHPDHWAHKAAHITDDTQVQLVLRGAGSVGEVSRYARALGGVKLQLCETALLQGGGIEAVVLDVFVAGLGEEPGFVVPRAMNYCRARAYAHTARQWTRYEEDGAIAHRHAEDDARLVNERVTELNTEWLAKRNGEQAQSPSKD